MYKPGRYCRVARPRACNVRRVGAYLGADWNRIDIRQATYRNTRTFLKLLTSSRLYALPLPTHRQPQSGERVKFIKTPCIICTVCPWFDFYKGRNYSTLRPLQSPSVGYREMFPW
jgi:hypothetical protein